MGSAHERTVGTRPPFKRHGVHARQLLHGDVAAAQCEGQPVVALAHQAGHPRCLQEIVEIRVAELTRDRNRRHVPAADEGVLGRYRTEEPAVEILRTEGTERGRGVLQNASRMQEPLVQRQGIDEGLQGGSRRALGGDRVDLTADRGIPIVRGTHVGANHRGSIAHLEQQRRGIANAERRLLGHIASKNALHGALPANIQRRAHSSGRLAQHRVGEVRRQEGQLVGASGLHGGRHVAGESRVGGMSSQPLSPQAAPRLVERRTGAHGGSGERPGPGRRSAPGGRSGSRGRGGLGKRRGVGPAAARVLRDHGQREEFRHRQLRQRTAKEHQARRTRAFDVASVRGEIEIGLENGPLAVPCLDPQ